MPATLHMADEVHKDIIRHLLPADSIFEEGAFAFARRIGNESNFELIEWMPVPLEGFVHRSPYYLELSDNMRGKVIKIAHDLEASIVELHSHPTQQHAEFSPSDGLGLREFVPHVWWRLKARPYIAIVVSRTSFDALVWLNAPDSPQELAAIKTENRCLAPTGLSIKSWDRCDEFTTL